MNYDLPEIDNCCDKEAYAFFGLAAYWAQVLEHSALNLAIVLRLPDVALVSQELFDDLYDSLGRKTFGQLLKAAKRATSLSDQDQRFLEETLELRNILMHRYFRERAEDFVSSVGQKEMKEELRLIVAKFKEADVMLERLYAPLWREYGVTDEFIERELERMERNAELRDKRA